VLKKETEDAWRKLRERPELGGFVLVGGSALALQIHHRESEDLDFAWPQAKLPRLSLELLKTNLPEDRFSTADDPIAVREADDCGMDLRDFSQTYVINDAVKVTFFILDQAERQVIPERIGQSLQVASLDEIFALKALACAKRSKSRDWYDLYILMKEHGYTFHQFRQVFVDAGAEGAYDMAVARLCSGRPNATDEGFSSLQSNPPTLEVMNRFFTESKDAYEQEAAEKEARRKLAE
jgi:hypothetical protein